jgi:hypothetical protein
MTSTVPISRPQSEPLDESPNDHDRPDGPGPVTWFKAMRGDACIELIRLNPNAFALAYIIARRTRYRDGFNADGLAAGEAMLGDYAEWGMTRQQYRTALRQLCNARFATIRATSRGTIARLMDTRLFDVLNAAANHPFNRRPTNSQPSDNHQPTNGQPLTRRIRKLKKEEESSRFAEIPSWQEFWDYCRSLHGGLTAEWYARDKWEAANAENWKRMANWRAYARRCRAWWEQDGRPDAPRGPGRNGKTQPRPNHSKGF